MSKLSYLTRATMFIYEYAETYEEALRFEKSKVCTL